MWLYKGIVVLGLAALTACQWSPVYEKQDAQADAVTAQVQIEPIPEEIGRVIRQELINTLNPKNEDAKKAYRLTVSRVQETSSNVGIVTDNTATQAIMHLSATYQLTEMATKKVLLSSAARVASNYNILRKEPYATVTARENTKKTLSLMLADQIALQVSKTLKQLKNNGN